MFERSEFLSQPGIKSIVCRTFLENLAFACKEKHPGLSMKQLVSLEKAAAIKHRKENILQFIETYNRKTIIKKPLPRPRISQKGGGKLQI